MSREGTLVDEKSHKVQGLGFRVDSLSQGRMGNIGAKGLGGAI